MSPKVTKGLPTGYGFPYEIKFIVLELKKYYYIKVTYVYKNNVSIPS